MSSWRAVGRVGAGAVTTVLLSVTTVILLPFLGIATAEVVGNRLPLLVFAVPLPLCAVAGGGLTGYLQAEGRRECTALGGLAAALGGTVVGVGFGLVALLVLLGMTPAHAGPVDLSEGALLSAALGGGAGFLVGGVLGAIGEAGAHVARRRFGR